MNSKLFQRGEIGSKNRTADSATPDKEVFMWVLCNSVKWVSPFPFALYAANLKSCGFSRISSIIARIFFIV